MLAGELAEPARLTSIVLRLGHGLVVLLLVATVAFTLTRFVGDPVVNMLGDQATQGDRAALRHELGLDQSLGLQLARFLGRLGTGDLGVSYRHGRPVAALFAERLSATFDLAVCALALMLLTGVPLGIWLAGARPGPAREIVGTLALIAAAVPTFVTGTCLILTFSVALPWLPSFGRGPTTEVLGWSTSLLAPSGWTSLLLPAVTLALYEGAVLCRLVRAAMSEELARPYILFARARGLPAWRVLLRHALPGAMPTILPLLGLQVGQLLVYTAVTETLFQWPGMGSLFVQAALFGDLPLLGGYLIYVGLTFVTINALIDLILASHDPRRGCLGPRESMVGHR
jgi:peptide/nickel transport system permease protein